MDHANNAVYADWLDEAIARGGRRRARSPSLPRRYRLEYALAAAGGDELESAAWPSDPGWSYRLTEPSAGSDIFRATLQPGDPGATIEEDG